jgi:hypothetical protein
LKIAPRESQVAASSRGPILAVLTARTPEDLRRKMMTALISANRRPAPLSYLIAGQALERWSVVPVFTVVVAGMTWMALVFATIALRHREPDAALEPVTP